MDKPSKSWAFTANNYTDKDVQQFKDLECNYIVFGYEIAESGTPHLQGSVTFAIAKRLTGLKKINDRVHWSIEIDRESSRNYCMKMQDYFIKDKRDQGARTDLKSVCDIVQTRGLAAAVADYPEVYVKFHSGIEKLNAFYRGIPRDQKPYVVWIYGPTGTGKTRMVYEQEEVIFMDVWKKFTMVGWL